jgi:hypothetical protein
MVPAPRRRLERPDRLHRNPICAPLWLKLQRASHPDLQPSDLAESIDAPQKHRARRLSRNSRHSQLTLVWEVGYSKFFVEGPAVKADAAINPNGMLPPKPGDYRYPGSLTTPPCSEVVEWLVLTAPIQVAAADVAGFAKLYPMNARPAQRDNRRYVL